MKQALDFLRQAYKKERFSHLYLIFGEKGSGKKNLVFETAHFMLEPFYKHQLHLKDMIKEQKIPNVLFIEPEGQSIKKEQILNLQQEFSKTSLVKGPRIYIINHVDKMTTSASNSLLKFMEEPSNQNTYGFLLTENKDVILPTILSRSQVIKLKNPDEDVLYEKLIEEHIDPSLAKLLPHLTKNFDQAIEMAIDPNMIELIHFMKDFAKIWHQKTQPLALFFMNSRQLLTMNRDFFKMFLELLFLYFIDLIHYKMHQSIIYEFLKEEIQQTSAQYDIFQIEEMTTYLKQTMKHQTYFINLDLALDQLVLKLNQSR